MRYRWDEMRWEEMERRQNNNLNKIYTYRDWEVVYFSVADLSNVLLIQIRVIKI